MSFQVTDKTKNTYENEFRFIYLSPSVYKCDGDQLQFTAFDTHLRCRVLIKRYSRLLSKETFAQMQLLRHLEHDNLAYMHSFMVASSCGPTYLVSELLDTTLQQLICTNQLTFNHASLFSYQMLRGLKYLHSADIVHSCLCPSNILVHCHNLTLKLSDMFLSPPDIESDNNHAYSSPEALMGILEGGDSRKTDVWSVGCLLVEMVSDHNFFQGQDEQDTLMRIIDSVPLKEIDWVKVLKHLPPRMLKDHTSRPRHPIRNILSAYNANYHLMHLLERMLKFDAEDRISTLHSLSHPFFSDYHCPEDEPSVDSDVLRILKKLSEQGEWWLGDACSVEDLCSLELQAGLPTDPHLLHLLTTPPEEAHGLFLPHSDRTPPDYSVSLSSSSSGSVHSAATYRHNLKELQSRLKQRWGGDSDKEQAEWSEEKRCEEDEMEKVAEALEQLGRRPPSLHTPFEHPPSLHTPFEHPPSLHTPFEHPPSQSLYLSHLNVYQMEQGVADLKMDELRMGELKIGDMDMGELKIGDMERRETISSTEGCKHCFKESAEKGVWGREGVWSREGVWGKGGKEEGEEGEKKKRKRSARSDVDKGVSEGGHVDQGGGHEGEENKHPFQTENPSHFDQLYRLPTDHLRRYADDMNHSLHGHHFFDLSSRSSRLSEGGACGGCDYGSLDDLPSSLSSSHHLCGHDPCDRASSACRPPKRCESHSSLESPPHSPTFCLPSPSLHTGARPKRYHKKFYK